MKVNVFTAPATGFANSTLLRAQIDLIATRGTFNLCDPSPLPGPDSLRNGEMLGSYHYMARVNHGTPTRILSMRYGR